MKLLRYGPAGQEKPGLLDSTGQIRDLSGVVPDIAGETLLPESTRPAAHARSGDAAASSTARRGSARASGRSASSSASGLNYSDHAAESGMAGAERADPLHEGHLLHRRAERRHRAPARSRRRPTGKSSSASSIGKPGEVRVGSRRAVACRRLLRRQRRVRARLSARRHRPVGQGQERRHVRADRPVARDADEVPDPRNLDLWLDVDGKRRQDGSTKTLIFGVAYLVSYISRFMSLQPGDIIYHRHAAGRRPRPEAAGLPARRQRGAPRRRRSRRAAPARGGKLKLSYR